MSEAKHSKWGASKFEADMLCPGKNVLEAGLPNSVSKYAAEGTVAHQVLTWALQESQPAAFYIGRMLEADGFAFEVDADMAGHVQVCIDYVRDVAGDDGLILVDQRVNYSSYLNVHVDDAWGTTDVIVIRGEEVITIDFKYGMGVEVSAERNPQMSLYALGALQALNGVVADFSRVRMAISQPRIKKAASEWDCSVDELEQWGYGAARSAIGSCLNARAYAGAPEFDSFLRPAEKACKFCKAKATCPKLREEVASVVFDHVPATPDEFQDFNAGPPVFQDNTAAWLATCLSKVDLIEDWCKAIRAETERRLLAGDTVPGYKLVQGKKGARQWSDAKSAEETLKAMRLKESEMYEFKLISPTTADKLAKAGTIGPRQWPKLQGLITQSEGKPHVAPVSDSRPALVVTPVVDDFTDVITADDLA